MPRELVVFDRYGEYYDMLYQDKAYEAECDAIEAIFQGHGCAPVRSLLDMGCGTGGHAIPLSRRGYSVVGVDASEVMVRQARTKTRRVDEAVVFHAGDMRSFRLDRRFDAVICMFASLGYLTETADLVTALGNFHRHLVEGGLLVLDVWNGIAVLSERPSERIREVTAGTLRLVRYVRPEVDYARHVCRNFYRLLVLRGDRLAEQIDEVHDMRFFFPQELAHYLEDSGFEPLRAGLFPEMDHEVDPTSWSLGIVARARS